MNKKDFPSLAFAGSLFLSPHGALGETKESTSADIMDILSHISGREEFIGLNEFNCIRQDTGASQQVYIKNSRSWFPESLDVANIHKSTYDETKRFTIYTGDVCDIRMSLIPWQRDIRNIHCIKGNFTASIDFSGGFKMHEVQDELIDSFSIDAIPDELISQMNETYNFTDTIITACGVNIDGGDTIPPARPTDLGESIPTPPARGESLTMPE